MTGITCRKALESSLHIHSATSGFLQVDAIETASPEHLACSLHFATEAVPIDR